MSIFITEIDAHRRAPGVDVGEIVGTVEGAAMPAGIAGLVRGMLRSGVSVHAGMKAGDIDPRLERGYCYEISDKAKPLAVGSWKPSPWRIY